MSQNAGLGGPTPRRSTRLSSKAGSLMEQSVVTTMTSGGTRQRKQAPLTKAKARRSNAYGASGRVGAAEEQVVSVTGFAQAFSNQRGDAVVRDDEEDEAGEHDDFDNMGNDLRMSGALNGNNARNSPPHERSSPPPRVPAPFGFSENTDLAFTDDDLDISIGGTSNSKSFGLEHEAGMLQQPRRSSFLQSSSQLPTPVPRITQRAFIQPIRATPATRFTPGLLAIEESSRLRQQREGLSQTKPTPQAASRLAPSPAIRPTPRQDLRTEPQTQSQAEPRLQSRSPLVPQPHSQAKTQSSRPEVVDQWLGQVEDNISDSEIPEDEPEWVWLPLVLKMFWGLMITLCVIAIAAAVSSAISDPNREVGMHTAVVSRISTMWYDTADYINPNPFVYNETKVLLTWLYGDGTGDDHLMWSRMWKNHKEYSGRFDQVDDAIEKLKADLPELLVVRRHPDERLEVTDEFWSALLSKAQSKSDDPTWTEFVKANGKKVYDLDQSLAHGSTLTARPQIVGKDEFIELMQQHYSTMSADVDRKIMDSLKTHEAEMKTLIQAEARKTLMDSIRLQSLAQSNLVANYELALKKANYFSVGLGALIDPSRTSSTFNTGSPSYLGLMVGSFRKPNPPIAALMKWDEIGDCWCAAPNPIKGFARVGVSLPRRMYPKQVTVEHVPMKMFPSGNIQNAPRNIELWAKTKHEINQLYNRDPSKCLDPGDMRKLGFVCLGSFKYNVHASNHVQTFDLEAELTVPTSNVVVQVTSNWGAPNTCIYRLRLHGDDAEKDHEYDVKLND
ncbi:hypothetical protein OPT61_g8791 [Boeremia exigua]|uniref:Uncharacterized protein n=1 Tax=Boeremia exigua TaxID=749465 RepID=A0ACC2HXP4_9PLEO|nr:hypothetical protein OPT61_g8791 [Boeremia exigua]